MRWLLNSGGETSKTTCCLNSTLLSHSGHFYGIPGKNANRCPTYLLKWLATCGKFWSSQFCFLIFSKNHTQKTHHQKPTSKTTCCLNSTLLNHSGHFYSTPWKKCEQILPPIFLNVMWHVVNVDLHSFFLDLFLRIIKENPSPKTNIKNNILFEQHPFES